jgi:catechol-2,3-dioxygenase
MVQNTVFLVAALAAQTIPLPAQLGAPNASGVAIGHVHLTVRNPEEHKKIWSRWN